MSTMHLRKKGLILAADFDDEKTCIDCISKVADFIDGIKIGNLTVFTLGFEIIEKLKKIRPLPVIGDFKIMDISAIATSIIKRGIDAGIDGFMICGVCGPEVLRDSLQIARDRMVFVFTEFTHFTGLIDENLSDYVAEMARDLGAYGIQAPATRPNRIQKLRKIVGDNLIVISCGVGEQGIPYGTAIANGANYEIVGRSIYLSNKPRLEAKTAKNAIVNSAHKQVNYDKVAKPDLLLSGVM